MGVVQPNHRSFGETRSSDSVGWKENNHSTHLDHIWTLFLAMQIYEAKKTLPIANSKLLECHVIESVVNPSALAKDSIV